MSIFYDSTGFFETIDISTPSSPSFIGDFDFKAFEVDWDQPIESWHIDENRAFLHNITTMWDEYTLGTKVRVLDTINNWTEILLSDGKTGWIVSDDIRKLKNF